MFKINNKEDIYEQLVTFVTTNQEHFYRFAYSYTREEQAALDAVQNAIYKALTKYQSLRDIQFLKTWFYRILVNESLTYLRTNKQLLILSEEIEKIPHSDSYNLDELNLYQEVNKLPDKLKTIIILRFYEEMTLEEISIITNTNLSTVKSRLYKALKLLKLNYKEIDPYE